MDNRKIGIFDSGVGGLSVLKLLKQALRGENYLYFGDSANLPYGTKSKEELLEITTGIFDWYKKQDVKAVVMACNTTSAVVFEQLAPKYDFKIYPIIQSSARELCKLKIKRLGVFATPATVLTKKYTQSVCALNPEMEVFELDCPGWVQIVENGTYQGDEALVKQKFDQMMEFKPDKIVLGCTHYPYLKQVLGKFADENLFIDPAQFFVKRILETIEKSSAKVGKDEFFVSENPQKFVESAKLFYTLNELPKLLKINKTELCT